MLRWAIELHVGTGSFVLPWHEYRYGEFTMGQSSHHGSHPRMLGRKKIAAVRDRIADAAEPPPAWKALSWALGELSEKDGKAFEAVWLEGLPF